MYTAANNPIGTAMRVAKPTSIADPRRALPMPPSPVDFVKKSQLSEENPFGEQEAEDEE